MKPSNGKLFAKKMKLNNDLLNYDKQKKKLKKIEKVK